MNKLYRPEKQHKPFIGERPLCKGCGYPIDDAWNEEIGLCSSCNEKTPRSISKRIREQEDIYCNFLNITADQLKIARACKHIAMMNGRLLICNPGHRPLELVDGELREVTLKPEIKKPTFDDEKACEHEWDIAVAPHELDYDTKGDGTEYCTKCGAEK